MGKELILWSIAKNLINSLHKADLVDSRRLRRTSRTIAGTAIIPEDRAREDITRESRETGSRECKHVYQALQCGETMAETEAA